MILIFDGSEHLSQFIYNIKIAKSIHIPRQHSSNQGSISYISMFKYDMGRFIFCYVLFVSKMMHEKGRINVR